MIDVVFLLLVFFLTTTTFVQPKQDLNTAISSRPAVADNSESIVEPAIVSLSRTGDQTDYRFGAVSTSDPERIAGMLRTFSDKSQGAFVEVGDGVPFGEAANMISICRAAGFSPVTWLAGGVDHPR